MSIPDPRGSGEQHQADLFGWDPTDPIETERQLRELLSGKRLVGELDLSRDDGTFQAARWVFIGATRTHDFMRLRHYPAVTAVFLVGEGGRCYDDGTFWPNIESMGDATPQERATVGKAFEAAVCQLGLEDFSKSPEADTWMRYVTPILLHGGIPASCARDAAQLIVSDVRQGVLDGAELIDGVLRSNSRKAHLDRPLLRFFSYGGDFALDLVERMINAIFDVNAIGLDHARSSVPELADDLGLPRYLLQALIDGGSPGMTARTRRVPRPQVRIDRYSCNGPYAVLPPVDNGSEWLLTGSSASRYRAMRRETHEVPLIPSRGGWSISRQSDTVEPRSHFNGHPDVAAYIFDAAGRLARDQRRLRGSAMLLLVAKGVEVVCDDDTPAPLAEELPARGEPWHGWKLVSVDLSEVDALVLRSDSAGLTARSVLPVLRPPQGPAITSAPVVAVRGPMGCDVYADAPSVTEPEGTAPSAWRVRWRHDDETSPPGTAVLENLPHGLRGRSLAPRLPAENAFCGTVEIVGPLGSDLRERVAVVRGLRVTVPDRVIGPAEAIEVTIDADCDLNCPNGHSGRSVTLQFEPGCEAIEVAAGSVPLTLTVPRLSWAVSYLGAPSAAFSTDLQRIGLDDIESGEVESLLVRCGRPATIGLELHGHELLHRAGLVHAAGEQGRWAFPLSQFRDTILASRLAQMSLRLRADDADGEAAVVFARYEVSELRVDVPEIEGREALIDVKWQENRRFRGRQLRLWSQHRPWEPPVCEHIPDNVVGAFDCIVEVPPGPYLAEVAVRDDWIAPQRPLLGTTAVEAHVGSSRDSQSRLLALRATVAPEALELVVAGHQRGGQIAPDGVASARSELRDAISASSGPAVPFDVLTRLVNFASSANGMLAEVLAEEMVGFLPSSQLLRVTLAMMSTPTRCTADPKTIETLWQAEPIAAAVLDYPVDDRSAERWERFAGWVPLSTDGTEQPTQPISKPLDELPPARLWEVADALPPMGSLALQFRGYVVAALEMLANTWPDRKQLNEWMSAHTRITTYTQRLAPSQRQLVDALMPPPDAAGWHRFPARLQAAAFQITDETAQPTDRAAAADALLDAAEIAPILTKRSLIIASAHRAASLA